jgi:hypothetical protein
MIIRMNFGFHGFSFGAPAPISNLKGDADLGGSITHDFRQNKPRNGVRAALDKCCSGFASDPAEGLSGGVKTIGTG